MQRHFAHIKDAQLGDSVALVITGSGDSFCAGGFLKELATPDAAQLRSFFFGSLDLFDAIRNAPVPIIAAVNGVAAGGGNELVVACDFAIAARSATFGQTGVRVGSAPVLGGTNLLAISIGEKKAKEVSMLCRNMTPRPRSDWDGSMKWLTTDNSTPPLRRWWPNWL